MQQKVYKLISFNILLDLQYNTFTSIIGHCYKYNLSFTVQYLTKCVVFCCNFFLNFSSYQKMCSFSILPAVFVLKLFC